MFMGYKLVRVLSRKNKAGDKTYYLAYLLYNTDKSCDLLNVIITKEQADKLIKLVDDKNFNINDYVKIEFNIYDKSYHPVITY